MSYSCLVSTRKGKTNDEREAYGGRKLMINSKIDFAADTYLQKFHVDPKIDSTEVS